MLLYNSTHNENLHLERHSEFANTWYLWSTLWYIYHIQMHTIPFRPQCIPYIWNPHVRHWLVAKSRREKMSHKIIIIPLSFSLGQILNRYWTMNHTHLAWKISKLWLVNFHVCNVSNLTNVTCQISQQWYIKITCSWIVKFHNYHSSDIIIIICQTSQLWLVN